MKVGGGSGAPSAPGGCARRRADARRLLAAAVLAVVVVAALGCGSTSPTSSRGSAGVADDTVLVPDFVLEGGESEFSKENAEASDAPRHYGSPRHRAAYERIAERSGLRVSYVYMSSSDDVFAHGMGGWPVGQSPPPGARAERGSIVKVVLIEDE